MYNLRSHGNLKPGVILWKTARKMIVFKIPLPPSNSDGEQDLPDPGCKDKSCVTPVKMPEKYHVKYCLSIGII